MSTANTWNARQTFNGGITGTLTGNADTATKLKTARTIGGVAFDGSTNINLPGVNTAGNQNTTGNAATATKLATARSINGVSFDGTKNISINTLVGRGRVTALTGATQGASAGIQMYEVSNNGYPTTYGNVVHLKGATSVGEGELLIGWSGTSGAHAPSYIRSRRDVTTAEWSEWAKIYTSKDSIPGVNTTGNQNTTGNAASATKLQTARTIGGVSFNGTANINLPGVNTTGNQNTTGNAATATKLQTARAISGVSFNGSANIEIIPVGVPLPWPSATPPTGWLKCNGAAFDMAKYPLLAKVYPTGKLPDLRGVFIRGWDDGRGIDTSRALLSEQQPKVGQFWARGTTYTVSPGSIYITDAILIGQSPSSVAVNNDSGASENYVEVTPVDTRPINNAFNYIVRAA